MARSEQAIFTNLVMVYDGRGNVLVQDRNDSDWPGICFPGGHVEPGESFVASAIREIKEETGLAVENLRLCGTKQFQTRDGARYVVFFYKTCCFSGELCSSEEGEVFWIPRSKLLDRETVPDFKEMLQVFESDDLSEFYYYNEDNQWKLALL
jgi:8-oxo-dGTP diphosphatase